MKNLKRVLCIPMILCMLTVSFGLNRHMVSAKTNEVFLDSTEVYSESYCGHILYRSLQINIQVKNIAFEKKVYVHYRDGQDGLWKDVACHYVEPTQDGYEMWTSDNSIDFGDALEYVIRYDVNGQTYWDNNDNRNYVTDYYNKTNF